MDIDEYTCPECGATETSTTADCCDECVLKFFYEDVNGPTFVWRNNG
jgi:hypothetical protein